MARWTVELATVARAGSAGCVVRLGVPTYEDDVAWHIPSTENAVTALTGIRSGLAALASPREAIRGVAIYADWTTDENEWAAFDSIWVRGDPGG